MVVINPPINNDRSAIEDCIDRCKHLSIPPSFKDKCSYGAFLSEYIIPMVAGDPPPSFPKCTAPECAGLSQVLEPCKGTTVKNYMWIATYMRVVRTELYTYILVTHVPAVQR